MGKKWNSKVDQNSSSFKDNLEAMNEVLSDYSLKLSLCKSEGSQKYIDRHKAQGKLLARERIEELIDPGTEFLELMPMAGFEQDDMTPGGSIVGGIATISGKPCVINANVATQKGGALNLMSVLKGQRLDVIARENKLPCVYLVESAGAHLPQQALVYNQGGATFREISRRSAMGLPNIAVVFGSSTAGGAYIPGMSDYIIMVKDRAQMFLAGPPLVKMAIKEESDEELLGGASMHARISGVADYLAESETDALSKVRELFSHLKIPSLISKPPLDNGYDQEDLLGILGPNLNRAIDIREIIHRLCDKDNFLEFKPEYGPTLICGHATLNGHEIGVIANQGVLFSEAAEKGAQFIQLCNQENRPLLFLQNITGFMVGKKAEQGGIIKHGAKMINAVSNSKVPAITVILGASYGAGNYAMCGRAFEPRFLFTWPQAKMAVMGADQLSGVLEIIKRSAAEKAGVEVNEEELAAAKAHMKKQIENESNSYFASSRLWDDGIIDPRDTRKILAKCFDYIAFGDREINESSYAPFRM